MMLMVDAQSENQPDQEAQWVCDLKAGSEAAFKELFFKYGKKLYYFSVRQAFTHEQAQNVVQESFAKLWEVRQTLDPQRSVQAYIFTIARHHIYNGSRKNINRKLFEKHLLTTADGWETTTEDTVVFNDYQHIVEEILSELSPRVQQVFRMNRFDGIPNGEIATRLGPMAIFSELSGRGVFRI